MFEKIKEFAKGVAKRLGLIESLNKITDHKQINVNESQYSSIEENKRLYAGHNPSWHDLEYTGSNGQLLKRRMKSMNMTKHVSKKLARLIFNEGVSITVDAENKKAQWGLVEDTFTSNKFKREFQRYLEYMFALGGLCLEIYLDGDEPKIAYATADAFFPLSTDSEQVDEAVIANVFREDGYIYTLLKWHEWGEWNDGTNEYNYRIKNELYQSKSTNTLGDKVNPKKLFPDLEPETYFNRETPLFIYLKPNEANNRDLTSPLGVGALENAKDTLYMLDVMYDFWFNEFRLGKRRVAVPVHMVRTHHMANGRPYMTLDPDEELFVGLNAGEMDSFEIKDLTVDIRSEQVIDSIQSLLEILSMQVGLSAGTFTFTQQGLKTATQVISENSETYQTRASHIQIIEDGLRDLIVAVYEVVTMDNETMEPLKREDISIDFDDGIFTDQDSRLDFYSKALKAGMIPKEVAIAKVFNLSDDDAKEWVADIDGEKQQNVARMQSAMQQAQLEIET